MLGLKDRGQGQDSAGVWTLASGGAPGKGPRRQAHRDPGVLEGLGSRDALGRVDGQHLIDEILGFRGDGVPFR